MKKLAEAKHRTPHWLMREAIEQYVEREEKRETFRQDGIRAWEAYQATGLHVTHAEADAWLEQLEAGNDVEPPKCHN
jgi:predicted transcriptional regulator